MHRIAKLLEKLRNQTCTPAELEELKTLLAKEEGQVAQYLDTDLAKANEDMPRETSDHIWQNVQSQISVQKSADKPNRLRLPLLLISFMAVVGLLVFVGYQWFGESQKVEPIKIENTESQPKVIALIDGTRVWLKNNSSLEYPEAFSKNRVVKLKGEAFFEVAKDPKHPFIVETEAVKTRVLGTAFNVEAFDQEKQVKVALVEGSVAVEMPWQRDTTIMLKPGEEFTYDKNSQYWKTNHYREDAPYAWKDGILYFDKADVHEVAQILRNWYDIDVTVKTDSLVSGKLVHRYDTKKLTLDEVLKGISTVMDYTFRYQSKGKVLIVPKQ